MRNLKKFFAVILAVAMLASLMVPALAVEEYQNAEKATTLNALGMYAGTSTTEFTPDLGSNLTRLQGIILQLAAFGETDDAMDMSAEDVAAQMAMIGDADMIPDWAKPYAAYALMKGYTAGTTPGADGTTVKYTISPNADLTGLQFMVFVLKALGYDVTTFTVNAVATLATDAGLSAGVVASYVGGSTLNRDGAVGVMYASLSGTVNGTEQTLVQKLAAADETFKAAAETEGLIATVTPTPVALAVESVTAINAKQIMVAFNQDLDATSAAAVANYAVYNNGTASIAVSKAVLQSDSRSVLLTLNTGDTSALSNVTNAKVVVKVGVKNAAGVALSSEYSNTAVAISDVTRPTVQNIQQLSPSKIKVFFNEPVKDVSGGLTVGIDNFQIDNGTYTISSVDAINEAAMLEYSVTITIAGVFTTGSHTLKINPVEGSDLADMVGLETVEASTVAFDYAPDTTAITATVTATQSTATITFDRIVSNVKDANVAYRHTLNGTQYQLLGTNANVTTSDASGVTVVTVAFNAEDFPLPTGSGNIFIAYVSGTGTKITDGYSNAFTPAASYVYSGVEADVTAPTATAVLVANSNDKIDVTFSEAVDAATIIAANFVLKKGTDAVANGGPVLQSGNTYRITTTAAMSGEYTLTVKNVKDTAVAPNTIVEVAIPVSVPDLIVPFAVNEAGTAANNYYIQDAATKVRIYFSEAMNVSDLATLTMYQNVSDSNANPTAATVAADGKSVYLTFANDPADNININGTVRDVAGNKLSAAFSVPMAQQTGAKVTLATAPAVKATSTTTITVALNDLVTGFTTADFEVDKDGGDNGYVAPIQITADNTSGKTILTLTLAGADAMAKNAWDTAAPNVRTVSTPGNAGATANAKNQFGVAVQFTGVAGAVKDMIAPELAAANSIVTMDADNDGKIDHIKVTFNEKVKYTTVNMSTFTVTDRTIVDAYASTSAPTTNGAAQNRTGATIADSTTVYITIAEAASADTAATPTVTIANTVKDVADNAYAGLSTATAAADKAAPVLLTAVLASAGTNALWENGEVLTLTFSEDVTLTGETVLAAAYMTFANVTFAGGADANDLGATNTIVADGTGSTVTLTATGDATTNVVDASITIAAKAAITDAAGNTANTTAVVVTN
jgi:hypothetical protein